jgi:hypothetical protein
MVDRLAAAQLEALYVLLRGMVGQHPRHRSASGAGPRIGGAAEAAAGEAAPAARHRFTFIGMMDGEPDLAERSARILREELGNPPT